MKRAMKIAMLLFLATAVLAGIGYWVFDDWFTGKCDVADWPAAEYDRAGWQTSAVEERYRFARAIIENGRFERSTRADLITELGSPSADRGSRQVSYVVRSFPNGGCGFNAIAILQFDLGDDGRVSSAQVRFD